MTLLALKVTNASGWPGAAALREARARPPSPAAIGLPLHALRRVDHEDGAALFSAPGFVTVTSRTGLPFSVTRTCWALNAWSLGSDTDECHVREVGQPGAWRSGRRRGNGRCRRGRGGDERGGGDERQPREVASLSPASLADLRELRAGMVPKMLFGSSTPCFSNLPRNIGRRPVGGARR